MASKKKTTEDVEETASAEETAAETTKTESTTSGKTAKPVSDYCVIVNLLSRPEQFSLTNGRTVTCGPKLKGRNNRSKAFLRKYVGPFLRELEKEKRIKIEAATDEEVNA